VAGRSSSSSSSSSSGGGGSSSSSSALQLDEEASMLPTALDMQRVQVGSAFSSYVLCASVFQYFGSATALINAMLELIRL
jgi:hypothetical protein